MSSSFDFFAALRYRDFTLISINQLCLTLAILIQEIVVAYSLYQLSKDPLMLGLIGIVELIPFILLSFFGGYIADRFNRQTILKYGFSLTCITPLLLILIFLLHQQQTITLFELLLGIFSCIFCLGILRGIYSPAFNSLRCFLVPEKFYSNANTWTTLIWQLGAMLGPLIAGILLHQFGLYISLGVAFIFLLMGSIAICAMQPRQFPSINNLPILSSMKEAILFMRHNRLIFWSMLLDLSTVLFGGILVLLPIFAEDILASDAEALGLLRAAPAIGTCAMTFLLMQTNLIHHAWRNMLIAVTGLGCCTLLFACSRSLWLSFILLLLMGAFDSMSMIIRQTLLQILPPKNLLGRIAAINGIVVTSGNQIGSFQSGLFARLFSVIPATLIGGSICLFFVGISASVNRDLLKSKIKQHKHTFLTSHK